MILSIFKPLILALYVIVTFSSPVKSRDPVCIVGAGITGLSAAHRLKEKGYSVKLFEKEETRVGGKMHSFRKDGVTWNMGPVLFTDFYNRTLDYIKKFDIKYETSPLIDIAGYQPDTGVTVLSPQQEDDLLVTDAFARYYELRKSYTVETGLVNANPELFVSTSEWLKKNSLEALTNFALIFLTAEGYGHIDDTPALYFVQLLDLRKQVSTQIHTIPDGMDQIPFALAKGLDITLNAQVSKIERNENGAKVTYSTNSGSRTEECSSAILAFPPLLNQLSKVITDLSQDEKDILDQVKIHKYASIANYTPDIKYFIYAPLLPPPFPPKLDGAGPAAVVNQTRGAAPSYHWTRGNFDAGPTDEELALYKSEADKVLPKLFPSKDTKTNIYVKGWDYFPHVTTESLQSGFYKKFHSIQGKNNIYYATPLISLEIIENSIRAAEFVVDSFY